MEATARESGPQHRFGVGILRFGRLPIVGRGDAIWSWIHADDAAAALVAVAEAAASGLWHVVDDEPVTAADYLRYFAGRLGAPEPRQVPVWLARLLAGTAAVEFMTSSTRTSNERFRKQFGWTPRFPTYREGLAEVLST